MKEWKHWKTFQNYVTAYETEGARLHKLQVQKTFLSYKLYEYIDECETHDSAIIVLASVFFKTTNKLFGRYVLATTRKKLSQTMDKYLQELKSDQ